MHAILLGLTASFFFTFAFVCNRSMDLSGGYWVWSGVLRYLFMAPILLVLVAGRRRLGASLAHLKAHLRGYFIWSTVGFGLFYAPQCFAGYL